MDINRICPLILKDVYYYDISACHYQILKGFGFDMTSMDINDKLKRNIKIGLLMKENPRLTTIIRNVTTSTITSYINLNEIKEEDIILRAYDGIITTKKLYVTTNDLTPIELQHIYEVLIISSARKSYIARNKQDYTIKGVSHRYEKMDKILQKIANINLSLTKEVIFNSLERIKKELFESEDPELFCIPTKNKYLIFIKGYGETLIGKGLIKILDTSDIDKQKYFELYLRQFMESIVIENI